MAIAGSRVDDTYLPLLRDVPVRPVFILGLNRSGTSILYHLLHRTGCFNAVTVFHLVHRNCLLHLRMNPDQEQARRAELLQWFEDRKLTDRRYDSVPVGPDSPEEYGYALGSSSPTPRLRESNKKYFSEFAGKIQFVGDPQRPLLLKNPWDTNNFLEIQHMWPEARFIFIHRNPVPVLSSQLKMFGGLIQRVSEYDMLIEDNYRRFCESRFVRQAIRAVCSDALPFLFWRLYRNTVRCCDYMLKNAGHLGEKAISITYPGFCRDANGSVREILAFLGLDPQVTLDLDQIVRPREQALHPTVQFMKPRIEERTQEYCRFFNV